MGDPERIVVIENDAEFGSAMSQTLSLAGYDVQSFQTAADGQAQVTDQTRLAVVEIGLPDDGVEVCREIRAAHPDIKLLLISSAFRSFDHELKKRLPVDEVLSRPFGHFELLESAQRLLHGKGGNRPVSHSGELPMSGSLGDYPFEALLYKLFDSHFTGRLVLERRKSNKVIYFLRGFPASATSNTHAEALGTLLVNRGVIRRSDLNRQLERLRKEGGSFGKLLIEAQLITEQDLQTTLDEQVRERVISCFEMRDGTWGLYPGDSFALQQSHFYVQNPIELIFLGISRFEETNTLAERIQERAAHFVIPTRHFARLLPYFPLGDNRKLLVASIDGQTTLAQMLQSWSGDFAVFFRVIWALMAARLVFLSPQKIPARLQTVDKILAPSPHIGTFLTVHRAAERREGVMASSPNLASVSRVRSLLDLEHRLDELTYFDLFDVSPVATPMEVRGAVERRIKSLNPQALKHLKPEDLGRITKVARRLKQAAAVLLDPDQRAAYRSLVVSGDADADIETGVRALERGRLTDAHAIFSKVEAKEPANARACALLGRTLHLMNGVSESSSVLRAKALINRAIALDENYADSHFYLGALLKDLGELDAAKVSLERAIQLVPTHDESRKLRASIGGDLGTETMRIGPWLFKEIDEIDNQS